MSGLIFSKFKGTGKFHDGRKQPVLGQFLMPESETCQSDLGSQESESDTDASISGATSGAAKLRSPGQKLRPIISVPWKRLRLMTWLRYGKRSSREGTCHADRAI